MSYQAISNNPLVGIFDGANTVQSIQQAIQDKIKAFTDAGAIGQWRFRVGALEGAQAPGFDDSGWETVKLPHTWSSLDGEGWFRAAPTPPAEVNGIPLVGSALELDIFLPIGAAVYVNGKERYREQSWSDTRAVPLLLTETYQPGSSLALAVRCNAGDGFALFIWANLRFSRLAQIIFNLDLIAAQMAFTRFLMERNGQAAPEYTSAWHKAAAALDLAALAANDWPAWWASVEAARAALAPFTQEAKTYTAHLIAHSHIDMNWLWPMSETVDVCRRDFATMDRLMAAYPEFHFSQSQAATYRAIELDSPTLFERIKARAAEGRWDITANTWVEGDLNMTAGETLVRQVLHARRYINSRFGAEPLICWEPDTFGHPATIPQILAKSGIKFYYFCRAGKRHPLFRWEGLDGSQVLAVQDPRGYNGVIMPTEVAGSVMDFSAGRYGPLAPITTAKDTGLRRGLFVYGAGDHGGGGTARDIEAARAITAAPFLPVAQPSSTVAFYQHAQAEAADLPVVRGELNTVFEGCYTSHGDIKRLNRDCENGLLTAETTATLAALMTGAPYPLEELAEAWRTLCFHQFHDILCGCAIGVTYREAHERLAEVLATAERTKQNALAALARATDTGTGEEPALSPSKGTRIVVFNPLAWERADVVRVPLSRLGGLVPAAVADEAGRLLPVQVSGDDLLFVTEGLPALGISVYRPVDQASGKTSQVSEASQVSADASTNILDNGVLSLRVHPASGALDQLMDHETSRNLAGPRDGWGPEARVNAGMLNRLQILWEQPHSMSAWNIGDIARVDNLIAGAEVKVIEAGPVRAAVEVRRRFLNSAMTQRIVLYRGLRRIDFETEVDWHERGSAHQDAPMLRATFAPFLGQTRATFEIPFAGLERPADGREVPAQRWADVSEVDYGVSLLNDGKYGHQAHGNTLGLTLVRASYEPDVNPDEGLHRFTYSFYPHLGDWRAAGTIRRAAEFNQPALVTVTDGHAGPLRPGQPWLRCAPENVQVSAIKLAEDQPAAGKTIIVRLYETHGRPANAVLRLSSELAPSTGSGQALNAVKGQALRLDPGQGWPILRAEEVDLIERPAGELPAKPVGAVPRACPAVEKGKIRLALGAHEIKTVKLYMA